MTKKNNKLNMKFQLFPKNHNKYNNKLETPEIDKTHINRLLKLLINKNKTLKICKM